VNYLKKMEPKEWGIAKKPELDYFGREK